MTLVFSDRTTDHPRARGRDRAFFQTGRTSHSSHPDPRTTRARAEETSTDFSTLHLPDHPRARGRDGDLTTCRSSRIIRTTRARAEETRKGQQSSTGPPARARKRRLRVVKASVTGQSGPPARARKRRGDGRNPGCTMFGPPARARKRHIHAAVLRMIVRTTRARAEETFSPSYRAWPSDHPRARGRDFDQGYSDHKRPNSVVRTTRARAEETRWDHPRARGRDLPLD